MTDEMLRELNALIVQAKETADYTRKISTLYRGTVQGMQTIGNILRIRRMLWRRH